MAALRLPLRELEAGGLPAVCAKSGQPAASTVRTVARKPVEGSARLLLLGIVPYFVVRARHSENVRVDLPIAADVRRRLARWVYVGRTTSLASVIVMVVGAGATSVPILLGGIFVGVVSLIAALVSEVLWVDATLIDDMVLLERVHPAFKRTLAMRGTRSGRRLPSPP